MTPNPITASRERIVRELDQKYHRQGDNGEAQLWLDAALLRHEATVKEEMARIVEGIKQPDDPHSPYWQLGFERAKKTAAQAIRTTKPTL